MLLYSLCMRSYLHISHVENHKSQYRHYIAVPVIITLNKVHKLPLHLLNRRALIKCPVKTSNVCQNYGDDLLLLAPQSIWKGDILEWVFCEAPGDSESLSGSECNCDASWAATYTGTAGRDSRDWFTDNFVFSSSEAFRPLKWITKFDVCCSKDMKSSWISENCHRKERKWFTEQIKARICSFALFLSVNVFIPDQCWTVITLWSM